MKLSFIISLYSLIFIFSSLFCMKKEDPKIPKVTASMHLSFIEALLAGGNFCVHTDSDMLEFKHFKKEKHFLFPIDELEALTGTDDIFSVKDPTAGSIHPKFIKPYNVIKKLMLEVQHKRLCDFNAIQDYSLLADDEINVVRQQNRKRLQKALSEKNSAKIAEACPTFLCEGYDCLIQEPRLNGHLEKIKEPCLIREKFAIKIPHLKYFISFFDAAINSQNFHIDSEKQTIQFKHFKKDKLLIATLFVHIDTIHQLFAESIILNDIAHYLEANISCKKDIIQKLSLLKKRQRKMFIAVLRLTRYFEKPFAFSDKRSELKRKLKTMTPEQRELLDGFSNITRKQPKGSENRKLHVYAGEVVKKIQNQDKFRMVMDERKVDHLAELKLPLAIEFIPFQEEFEALEAEVEKIMQ